MNLYVWKKCGKEFIVISRHFSELLRIFLEVFMNRKLKYTYIISAICEYFTCVIPEYFYFSFMYHPYRVISIHSIHTVPFRYKFYGFHILHINNVLYSIYTQIFASVYMKIDPRFKILIRLRYYKVRWLCQIIMDSIKNSLWYNRSVSLYYSINTIFFTEFLFEYGIPILYITNRLYNESLHVKVNLHYSVNDYRLNAYRVQQKEKRGKKNWILECILYNRNVFQ